jgi:hypothetical protein
VGVAVGVGLAVVAGALVGAAGDDDPPDVVGAGGRRGAVALGVAAGPVPGAAGPGDAPPSGALDCAGSAGASWPGGGVRDAGGFLFGPKGTPGACGPPSSPTTSATT